MMASRVTPLPKEEGAEVEGMVEAGGLVVFVHGRFGRSWASLRQTEAALMVPVRNFTIHSNINGLGL